MTKEDQSWGQCLVVDVGPSERAYEHQNDQRRGLKDEREQTGSKDERLASDATWEEFHSW